MKLSNIFKSKKRSKPVKKQFVISQPFNVQHVYHVGIDGIDSLPSNDSLNSQFWIKNQPLDRTMSLGLSLEDQ